MNKKQWNSVDMDGSVPEKVLHHLIDHSYDLVVLKLPAKDKKLLEQLQRKS